jgi:hypothetical protein
MVDAGASAGQIAGALGTSRNAIIGIVSREGWKLAGQSGDTARAQRFAAKRSGAVKPRKPREKKVRAAPPPAPVASFPEPKKVRMARPAAGKVRLRHRDGARWLRMDGLGWVEDRRQSYLVDTAKLGKVRSAFPLAAECVAVPETPWKPRDGRDVRQSW